MNNIIPLRRNKESADLKSIRLFNPKSKKTIIFCYCESKEIESIFKEGWEVARVQKTLQNFLSEVFKNFAKKENNEE